MPRKRINPKDSTVLIDQNLQPSSKKKTKNDNGGKEKQKKVETPVDSECSLFGKAEVLVENGVIFDATLNQTNIGMNNNKYFIIQLLRLSKKYFVWFHWGRVGYKGQNKLNDCGSNLEKAKSLFENKFLDKTKNDWSERDNFTKYSGKYDLVAVDFSASSKPPEDPPKENMLEILPSKLSDAIQTLMTFICNIKTFEETVRAFSYDSNKAPLGNLTERQIHLGYEALKQIEQCILKNQTGALLKEACSLFYTRIPHCFGMQVPPLIATVADVKVKLQLLDVLRNLESSVNLLNKHFSNRNPIDDHYEMMACKVELLPSDSTRYGLLSKLTKNTHGPTHSGFELELLNVYEVSRNGEQGRFKKGLSNHQLLWHGSRVSNWYGILKEGLRIAPPEAPSTGYMFGKGIYFADSSSKSANYCHASPTFNKGLLVLCEVALGKCNELIEGDCEAEKLPKNTHSVHGLGKLVPNLSECEVIDDNVFVPCGHLVESNDSRSKNFVLQYNEYVVYNVVQVRMRYLCHVEFKFKY